MKKKMFLVVFLFASICAVSHYSGHENPKGWLAPKISNQYPRPHMELAGALIEKYGVDPKHLEMIELEISMAVNYRKDIPKEMLLEIYALDRVE